MLNLCLVFIFAYGTFFFTLAKFKKDYSVVDIGWGVGIAFFCALVFLQHPQSILTPLLLVSFWALRLSWYIFKRSMGKQEDPRYTKLRNEWGKFCDYHAYLKIFLFQSALMIIVGLPVWFYYFKGHDLSPALFWTGLFIWTFGLLFEIWADSTLKKFLQSNSQGVCKLGPWKYSRHPNYFGEVVLWWGLFILTFHPDYWWITLWGPVIISFLILKVTGIPPVERRWQKNPKYKEYLKTTSRFFPLPPRKKSEVS